MFSFSFTFGLDALFDEEVGEERSEDENPGEELEGLWAVVLGTGDEYQNEGSNYADQVVDSKDGSDESEVQGEGDYGEVLSLLGDCDSCEDDGDCEDSDGGKSCYPQGDEADDEVGPVAHVSAFRGGLWLLT